MSGGNTHGDQASGVVVAGSSSKAFQPLSPIVPKNRNSWDTAVPATHLKLSENVRRAFATLSDAIDAMASVYNTDTRQMPELHEMLTGDSLFVSADLVLTDSRYNLKSRAEKSNSEMIYSRGKVSGIS